MFTIEYKWEKGKNMKKSIISVLLVTLLLFVSGCTQAGDGYKVARTMNTDAYTAIVVDDAKQNVGILDSQSVIDAYKEASSNLDDIYMELDDEMIEEGLDYVFAAMGYYYETVYQLLIGDSNFEAVYLGDDSNQNSIDGVTVLKFTEAPEIEVELIEIMNDIAREEIGEAVYVQDNFMVVVNAEYINDVDAFLALAKTGVASVIKK
ncbi:hypothetical protein ERAN111884_00710 [Erysipelothrix anatis]